MGYSYWCSHLKQTIHIAHSVFHFPTKSSSVLQAHWYPTCILEFGFPNRRTTNTDDSTLSPFRGLFNDHIRPIIFLSYLRINPKVSSSTSWRINNIFQRTFRTLPICFTKVGKVFRFTKFFFIFFFKVRKPFPWIVLQR